MTEMTAPTGGANTSQRRSRGGRMVCLAGLVGSALALSTPWLSPYSLIFDLLSHFTLHYVIAACACLIGYFLPRARVLTALVLIVAGAGAIAWWPYHVSAKPAVAMNLAPGERKLRLMTYNTWLSNKDWRAVAAEIRRHDPDVVTLIEFGQEKFRVLTELKRNYPYSAHCIDKAYCYMAILSKLPISDVGSRTMWKGPTYIKARLGAEYGGVYVYGLHSTRPPFVRSQIVQLKHMAQRLKDRKERIIVMGDFNSTPFSRLLNLFADVAGLKRITYLPTWPTRWGPFPQLAIDHIFLSQGMRKLSEPWIGRHAGSDHVPTVVDIAIVVQP